MFKSLSPIEIALIKKISGKSSGGGGGGGASASPKDVNFYDYDGILIASYSLSEVYPHRRRRAHERASVYFSDGSQWRDYRLG